MNKIASLLTAATLAVSATAVAQNSPLSASVVDRGPGNGSVAEALQLQGKIRSVDRKARAIVVVGPNGNEIRMQLNDEVRNFDQIHVGDLVTLTMLQALALELRKVDNSGIRERVDSERTETAKAGEKPGIVIEKKVQVIANVVALNPKAQTVTLRGPKQTLELRVNDPAMLQNVRVGDQVAAAYTEAVVLAVSPGPKK